MTQAKSSTRPRTIPKVPKQEVQFKKIDCTFHQFFAVWAQVQVPKWDIPDLHFDIIDFLTNYEDWHNRTGVVQIFRGAGKSTIVGLFVTWMLSQNPTLRFLILSADKKTATKITSDVAEIIKRHPLAKHLHGQEGAWRHDHLVVAGATDGRNPSVTSWGIGSSVTGSRADWIIYDDTEVPKNSQTESERDNLRARLDEPTHVLVPGGYELFVGTPHSYDSIYPEILGESAKDDPFRSGASSLKVPVMTDVEGEYPAFTGTPVWPERFPLEEIVKRAKASLTKGHFLSQYLLLPYNPAETVLDPTLINTYKGELEIHRANGGVVARVNGERVVGVSCFWDPSSAKLSADDSVLAIVYASDHGHYYVHRAEKLEGDVHEQVESVIACMRNLEVPHVIIEQNGVGEFLPAIFRKAAAGKGVTCEGRYTSKNKVQKILEAYEVRLSGGFIHCHQSVMDGPFRTQLRDFNPRTAGRLKDDFIDSVASAIQVQPIRLKAGHIGERFSSWQQGHAGFEAQMDGVTF